MRRPRRGATGLRSSWHSPIHNGKFGRAPSRRPGGKATCRQVDRTVCACGRCRMHDREFHTLLGEPGSRHEVLRSTRPVSEGRELRHEPASPTMYLAASSGGQFRVRRTRSMKSPPSPVAKSYQRPSLRIENDPMRESPRSGDRVLYSSPSHREPSQPNIRSIRRPEIACLAKEKSHVFIAGSFSVELPALFARSGTP